MESTRDSLSNRPTNERRIIYNWVAKAAELKEFRCFVVFAEMSVEAGAHPGRDEARPYRALYPGPDEARPYRALYPGPDEARPYRALYPGPGEARPYRASLPRRDKARPYRAFGPSDMS
jgi:hypothetical protein